MAIAPVVPVVVLVPVVGVDVRLVRVGGAAMLVHGDARGHVQDAMDDLVVARAAAPPHVRGLARLGAEVHPHGHGQNLVRVPRRAAHVAGVVEVRGVVVVVAAVDVGHDPVLSAGVYEDVLEAGNVGAPARGPTSGTGRASCSASLPWASSCFYSKIYFIVLFVSWR